MPDVKQVCEICWEPVDGLLTLCGFCGRLFGPCCKAPLDVNCCVECLSEELEKENGETDNA